jgi:hypothetical protein
MTQNRTRRAFLRKAAYVPPILLSFRAAPSFARPGSIQDGPGPSPFQTPRGSEPAGFNVTQPNAPQGNGAGGSSVGINMPSVPGRAVKGTASCGPEPTDRTGLLAWSPKKGDLPRSESPIGSAVCEQEGNSWRQFFGVRDVLRRWWNSKA